MTDATPHIITVTILLGLFCRLFIFSRCFSASCLSGALGLSKKKLQPFSYTFFGRHGFIFTSASAKGLKQVRKVLYTNASEEDRDNQAGREWTDAWMDGFCDSEELRITEDITTQLNEGKCLVAYLHNYRIDIMATL